MDIRNQQSMRLFHCRNLLGKELKPFVYMFILFCMFNNKNARRNIANKKEAAYAEPL